MSEHGCEKYYSHPLRNAEHSRAHERHHHEGRGRLTKKQPQKAKGIGFPKVPLPPALVAIG